MGFARLHQVVGCSSSSVYSAFVDEEQAQWGTNGQNITVVLCYVVLRQRFNFQVCTRVSLSALKYNTDDVRSWQSNLIWHQRGDRSANLVVRLGFAFGSKQDE